jgi:hypothetical protein
MIMRVQSITRHPMPYQHHLMYILLQSSKRLILAGGGLNLIDPVIVLSDTISSTDIIIKIGVACNYNIGVVTTCCHVLVRQRNAGDRTM